MSFSLKHSVLLACIVSSGALAESKPTGAVPHEIIVMVNSLSKASGGAFWKGVQTLDEDGDSKVKLVSLVKALQSRGFARPSPKVTDTQKKQGRRGRRRDTSKADLAFIKLLDSNKDKHVEKDELAAAFKATLMTSIEAKLSLDANSDGKITLKEYALSSPAKGGKTDENGINWHQRSHFEREDPNKDGFISVDEIFERAKGRMGPRATVLQLALRIGGLDRDGDQVLSVEECESAIPGWRKDKKALPLKDAYAFLLRLSGEDRQILGKVL